MRYLKNALREFPKICYKYSPRVKDELGLKGKVIMFQLSEVKVTFI